jgi:hypothetical protein
MLSTSPRSTFLAALGGALLLVACGNGTSTGTSTSTGTGGAGTGGAGTGGAGTGGSAPSKGLTISAATMASLNGTYDLQLVRTTGTGTGLAYNGNFMGKIEMEIDTDAAGAVLAAHVWDYTGPASSPVLDKFYGCDSKATACTGVTVDVTTNVITLGSVTWPEVSMVSFDPAVPDTLATGGGKVTVSGVLQAM